MPSMIDGLFISLGIDTKDFIRGQRDATESMRKTKDAVVKNTRETEAAAKSLQDAVSSLTRNFVTFFAVVAGTSSLKSFAEDVTKSDTALGRLAERLNIAPQVIGAWGLAIERFGGSAQDAAAAFQGLSDKMNAARTGNGAEFMKWISQLQKIGDTPIRLNKGIQTTLIDISTALANAKAKGQGSIANYIAGNLVPPGAVTILDQGPKVVAETLADTNRLAASAKQIGINEDLLKSFVSLQQTIIALGRDLETSLAPHVAHVVDKLQSWIDKNKEWLDQKIGDAIQDISESISDFVSSKGFKDFISYMSNPETWDPFTKWVVTMAKAETWKGFIGAIDRIASTLKSILDTLTAIATSPAIKFLFDPAGLGRDLFNKASGAPSGNDPLALAPGPYANTDSGAAGWFGRNLRQNWANRPRFLGGRGSAKERHPRPGKGDASVPFTATSMTDGTGITQAQYDAFREGLTDIEGKRYNRMGGAGGRYAGRYQMGPNEITETAARLGVPRPTNEQFLNDPQMQERFFERKRPVTAALRVLEVARTAIA